MKAPKLARHFRKIITTAQLADQALAEDDFGPCPDFIELIEQELRSAKSELKKVMDD